MSKTIERLQGGVAAVASMQGIGWPRIAFAPPGDEGTGDDKANVTGDDTGGTSDGTGDASGDDKGGGTGNKSALDGKGLFSRRGKQDGGGDDGDDKSGVKEPSADGRPEGLADKFWNAKDKTVNTEALLKSYRELETAHGTLKRSKGTGGGEVPETADGYFEGGVDLPKDVTNIPLPPDDPGLKAWGKVAHKYGIGKDAAVGIVKDYLSEMNGFVEPPVDPEKEIEALGKGGEALIDGVFVWAEGKANGGQFSAGDIDVIAGLSETAAGIRFLARVREMTGEQRIPIDPGTGRQGMTYPQWQAQYKAAIDAKDYNEQARLDDLAKDLFGDSNISMEGGYSSEKAIARR